jgi:inhibitor of cysteine peptidase
MMKRFARPSVLILLAAVLALGACAPAAGEVPLGISDNGSQVEVDLGWVLVISLESNPSTGYGWHVAEIDPARLEQVGEAEFSPADADEQLVGAPGVETLRFKTVGSGITTLTLTYDRTWEDDSAEQTFTLTVSVP